MLPLPVEVTNMPTTIGRVRRPEVVAETPLTYCMNVGRKVIAPNIANPTTNDSTQHTVNTGLPNSRIGRIGWREWFSTQTNTPSATAALANRPIIVAEPHGWTVPPQLVARVRPVALRPMNRMPA